MAQGAAAGVEPERVAAGELAPVAAAEPELAAEREQGAAGPARAPEAGELEQGAAELERAAAGDSFTLSRMRPGRRSRRT